MGVTIYDVAKVAGVSHTTVSNVINAREGAFPVSDKTRKLVWEVIEKTGYRPSYAARALAFRRTNVIGCLVHPNVGVFTNYFYREVFAGVEEAVLKSKWSLLIDSIGRHARPPVDEKRSAMPMRLETDGYLVFANAGDDHLDELRRRPAVFVECDAPGEGFSRVSVDNAQGGRLVADHLLSLGHSRIAVLRGAEDNSSANARFDAMRARLEEEGLDLPGSLVASNFGNPESGYASAREVLDRGVGFTAVAAFNDGAAFGAIRALREVGLRVPDDVSVVGFDDVPFFSGAETPLTTVHVPAQELGARAARMLIGMLDEGGSGKGAEEVVLGVSLVVRGTTAAPGRGWSPRSRPDTDR